jgi:uncharacterized lipoprotein YmbA
MKLRNYSIMILVLGAFLTLLGGCGTSEPSRFYLLSLANEPAAAAQNSEEGPSIEIGPVSLPEYLDRQQIVVRSSQNELRLAEYDRWAEPLKANFTRVLAGNLCDMLDTNRVSLFSGTMAMPAAYRVAVDVTSFEAGPDGTVSLDARWVLIKNDEARAHLMNNSCIRKPTEDAEDYAELVSAKSDALEDLSREIAETITALEAKASG